MSPPKEGWLKSIPWRCFSMHLTKLLAVHLLTFSIINCYFFFQLFSSNVDFILLLRYFILPIWLIMWVLCLAFHPAALESKISSLSKSCEHTGQPTSFVCTDWGQWLWGNWLMGFWLDQRDRLPGVKFCSYTRTSPGKWQIAIIKDWPWKISPTFYACSVLQTLLSDK